METSALANIFEMYMLLCFGASWPISLIKMLRTRSVESRSLVFFCLIALGYVCGILAKIFTHNINYVMFFYVFNLLIVIANISLFLYYKKRAAAQQR